MSSMPRSVALLGVGAALTMACTAFVAPSGQGRLRAARAQPQVNKGRVQVNGRPFTIRGNPQQSELKFTKYQGKGYEADPLTTMFVKARVMAFADVPNLFAQQSELKFTKYQGKGYEADPLTTMFVKARVMAFADVPNLFALPQPNMDELVPAEEVDKYTRQEYTTRMMEALIRSLRR
eukprot:s2605_g4.t1